MTGTSVLAPKIYGHTLYMAIWVPAPKTHMTAPQEAPSQRPSAATGKITASALPATRHGRLSISNRPCPPREYPVSIAQYCRPNQKQETATSLMKTRKRISVSGRLGRG